MSSVGFVGLGWFGVLFWLFGLLSNNILCKSVASVQNVRC